MQVVGRVAIVDRSVLVHARLDLGGMAHLAAVHDALPLLERRRLLGLRG